MPDVVVVVVVVVVGVTAAAIVLIDRPGVVKGFPCITGPKGPQ